ncbi:hypothetical protein D3C81_1555570 [compost metagenome]
MGVHGGDEDRAGDSIDGRHPAERAGTQRGPEAGLHQVVAYLPGVEVVESFGGVLGEADLFVPIEIDHHRLQHALLAAVDGADHAGTGSGVDHPGVLLVGEQRLAELDPVSHLHIHGRLHAVVIEADDGHAPHRTPGLDTLDRLACHRQVQPPLDFDHSFRLTLEFCTQCPGPRPKEQRRATLWGYDRAVFRTIKGRIIGSPAKPRQPSPFFSAG